MGFRPSGGDRAARSDGDRRPLFQSIARVPCADADAPGTALGNPVLHWVRGLARPMAEYLRHLARLDRGMVESLQSIYGLRPVGHRLSLTLFVDFAQTNGLAPGEAAVLLGDAERLCADAMDYVVSAAMMERCGPGSPKPFTAGEC